MLEAVHTSGWHGDGLLIHNNCNHNTIEFVKTRAIYQPTVVFGGQIPETNLPTVIADNNSAGQLAATHFLNRGFKNFAWISIERGSIEQQRQMGYANKIANAGYVCAKLTWQSNPNDLNDWKLRKQWLSYQLKQLKKPLAVFVLDDLFAAELIDSSLEAGLSVPEDIAVIGVGNSDLICNYSTIPISSVDINLGEMAYRAAKLLDTLMSGGLPPKQPLIVPVLGLTLRKSSEMFAVSDAKVFRALKFIEANYTCDISINDVAHAAGLSLRSLHYAFRRELKLTPARHLLDMRLDCAKRQLIQTNGKLEMIAQQSGFKTIRNLQRCFVRALKTTPKKWRDFNMAEHKHLAGS